MCNWRFIRKFEETFFLPALSSKGKQTTLQFSTVSKKPKKNPWSDEESEAGSDEESPVAPREHVNRPTKGETALGLETAIFNGFEKKPHFLLVHWNRSFLLPLTIQIFTFLKLEYFDPFLIMAPVFHYSSGKVRSVWQWRWVPWSGKDARSKAEGHPQWRRRQLRARAQRLLWQRRGLSSSCCQSTRAGVSLRLQRMSIHFCPKLTENVVFSRKKVPKMKTVKPTKVSSSCECLPYNNCW